MYKEMRGRMQSKLLKETDSNSGAAKFPELSLTTNKCEKGPELNAKKN